MRVLLVAILLSGCISAIEEPLETYTPWEDVATNPHPAYNWPSPSHLHVGTPILDGADLSQSSTFIPASEGMTQLALYGTTLAASRGQEVFVWDVQTPTAPNVLHQFEAGWVVTDLAWHMHLDGTLRLLVGGPQYLGIYIDGEHQGDLEAPSQFVAPVPGTPYVYLHGESWWALDLQAEPLLIPVGAGCEEPAFGITEQRQWLACGGMTPTLWDVGNPLQPTRVANIPSSQAAAMGFDKDLSTLIVANDGCAVVTLDFYDIRSPSAPVRQATTTILDGVCNPPGLWVHPNRDAVFVATGPLHVYNFTAEPRQREQIAGSMQEDVMFQQHWVFAADSLGVRITPMV